MSKLPANKLFPHLQGWRFPASAIKAGAGINDATLTNIVAKTDLILCSDAAGQGKARQFCLADAYQIALLRRLSLLTGRVAWSAAALNRQLFEPIAGDIELALPGANVGEWEQVKERRKSYCEDINLLPAAYRERGSHPWFFYAGALQLATEPGRVLCARWDDGDRVLQQVLASGVVLNVTYLLEFVDCELANALQLDLEENGDA